MALKAPSARTAVSPARWTVLASGSGGNASLLAVGGFGVLLDAGLGPWQLQDRFDAAEVHWANVQAVLLTHTHSDHWRPATMRALYRRKIPLYCHEEHLAWLIEQCEAVRHLAAARLVRTYRAGEEFILSSALRCRPLALSHDAGATFGFRFEAGGEGRDESWSLGYAADLGIWDAALAEALADVDVLGLEFNHDVQMQLDSRRPELLIERVLGDTGHLSNEQAAALLDTVLERSTGRPLRHVVQLHLSRECNRPELARAAACRVLEKRRSRAKVHTSSQFDPLPGIELSPARGDGSGEQVGN